MSKNKLNKSKNNDNSKDTSNQFSTFTTVFSYCLLIILMPILTFFSTKTYLFDNIFGFSKVQSNIYSAVLAVVALHLALGLYLYRAYSATDKPKSISSKTVLDKQD